jgi:hypothetical protein
MASASFVEIISHFAGYLQIFHDIARDRSQYDETLAPGRSGDYTTPRPDYDHRFSPDDMGTKGGFVPELIADDVMDVFRGRLPKLSRDSLSPDTDAFPPALNPKLPMPTSGGGGGSGEAQITVTYREGGEETQLTVDQYNFMNDNDTNLPQEALAIVQPLISSLNDNAFTTLENLVANANAEIPTEWWMTKTDGGAVEFISAHDAAWAERDGTPDEHSVAPGYYVNGELEEPPVEPTPPAEFDDVPDTGQGIGQWASMGSNESINAALIADIGEGVRTMMVMGDYYKTDAIFQTNTIVDEDEVHVSGGEGEPSVTSGDNVATNIADFVQYASIYADLPTFSAGSNWIVDKVEGDYYSVHAVTQTNYLSDNDVATQVSANSHYNIVAGHNQLGNVALIVDGEIQYDLIIIQGSYHGMNVIFQNNILLNNDNIVVSADGADPSQSVNSGNNSLSNEGTIENYGGYDLREMIPGLAVINDLLAAGATSIDPDLGSLIAGHGGPLRVLYVTGDYYDINAVWQTNITSDVNVMYQLQNEPSADLLALHPDEDLTQSVNTGDNQQSNDAAIVDVNPDVTYVGGEVYTDSILVQAELVPANQDDAVNANTDALVTELIAFVDDSHDHDNCGTSHVSLTVNGDPIGSVLH